MFRLSLFKYYNLLYRKEHEAYQFLGRRMRKSGGAPQSLGSRKSSVIGLVGLGGKDGKSQSLSNIKEDKRQSTHVY